MEIIIVAIITALSGFILEMLRRSNNKTEELKDEIRELKNQVDLLESEVILWQEKYLQVLRQLAGLPKEEVL